MYSGIVAALTIFLVSSLEVSGELEVQETTQSFFRIETELLYFENINNSIASGKRCDIYSKCDPVFYAYLDLERPLSPWPGSLRKLQDHEYLGGNTNIDASKLSYTVAKNLCGGTFSSVNLRVEVFDHDVMTKSDLIDQFECFFIPNLVGEGALSAVWSPGLDCRTIRVPEKHRLSYRWRLYRISPQACGIDGVKKQSSASSTP